MRCETLNSNPQLKMMRVIRSLDGRRKAKKVEREILFHSLSVRFLNKMVREVRSDSSTCFEKTLFLSCLFFFWIISMTFTPLENLDKKRLICLLAQRPRSQKFNTERITLASFSLCYYMIDTSTKTETKETPFSIQIAKGDTLSPLSTPHSLSVCLHVHSPTSFSPFLQIFWLLRISPPLSTALCPVYMQEQ